MYVTGEDLPDDKSFEPARDGFHLLDTTGL